LQNLNKIDTPLMAILDRDRHVMFGRKTMEDHESKVSSTTPDQDQPVHDDVRSATLAASSLRGEEHTQEGVVTQAPPEGGLAAWLAGKSQDHQESVHWDADYPTLIVVAFFLAIMNTW
jgi:hypothetical protein